MFQLLSNCFTVLGAYDYCLSRCPVETTGSRLEEAPRGYTAPVFLCQATYSVGACCFSSLLLRREGHQGGLSTYKSHSSSHSPPTSVRHQYLRTAIHHISYRLTSACNAGVHDQQFKVARRDKIHRVGSYRSQDRRVGTTHPRIPTRIRFSRRIGSAHRGDL